MPRIILLDNSGPLFIEGTSTHSKRYRLLSKDGEIQIKELTGF